VKSVSALSNRTQELLAFTQAWSCGSGSALVCMGGLVADLVAEEHLGEDALVLLGE